MSARWINQVLAEHVGLDLRDGFDREQLAGAILEALPKDVLVAAIAESAAAVLRCQRCIPQIDAVAKEIGRNAAATVLLMLEVDLDDEPVAGVTAAEGPR